MRELREFAERVSKLFGLRYEVDVRPLSEVRREGRFERVVGSVVYEGNWGSEVRERVKRGLARSLVCASTFDGRKITIYVDPEAGDTAKARVAHEILHAVVDQECEDFFMRPRVRTYVDVAETVVKEMLRTLMAEDSPVSSSLLVYILFVLTISMVYSVLPDALMYVCLARKVPSYTKEQREILKLVVDDAVEHERIELSLMPVAVRTAPQKLRKLLILTLSLECAIRSLGLRRLAEALDYRTNEVSTLLDTSLSRLSLLNFYVDLPRLVEETVERGLSTKSIIERVKILWDSAVQLAEKFLEVATGVKIAIDVSLTETSSGNPAILVAVYLS